MWNELNLALVGPGHGPWYGDHTAWGWMAGFHGLYWPLVIGVIVAVLALSIRLTTRDVRHAEPAFRSSSHVFARKTKFHTRHP